MYHDILIFITIKAKSITRFFLFIFLVNFYKLASVRYISRKRGYIAQIQKSIFILHYRIKSFFLQNDLSNIFLIG